MEFEFVALAEIEKETEWFRDLMYEVSLGEMMNSCVIVKSL